LGKNRRENIFKSCLVTTDELLSVTYMNMNKKIIENLNKEIKSLMNKDFDLRKSLERLEKDLTVDDIEIEKLKKEKLKIKDKILAKQNELKLALDKTSVELVYGK